VPRVVLSGGCFQNRYLTERIVTRLRQEKFSPYWHQRIPPNDGGIALGQVVGALRRAALESRWWGKGQQPAALTSEIRNPKSEIRRKSDIRSAHPVPHSVRSLRDTEAPVASVSSAEPMPESFAISAFGFRISDFLRISAFGF